MRDVIHVSYSLMRSTCVKQQYIRLMEIYSQYEEMLKKEKDIRFLSIKDPAIAWLNSIDAIYEMCKELQKQIDKKEIPVKSRESLTNRTNEIINFINNPNNLFFVAKLIDFIDIGSEYQNKLGATVITGMETSELLRMEKMIILKWKNDNIDNTIGIAMKNLIAKCVFTDTTMTINIGNHVSTYNITKNILNNEINKITNTIYNLFESFYERNIDIKSLEICDNFAECFDNINYQGIDENDLEVANNDIFQKVIDHLCGEKKFNDGSLVPPRCDETSAKLEFKTFKREILFKNRNKKANCSITSRIGWIYNLIKSKYSRLFPNILKIIEFFYGQKMHVIDNERLNSLRTNTQSVYAQHMVDDMLNALIAIKTGKNDRPENYYLVALQYFLETERRLANEKIFKDE